MRQRDPHEEKGSKITVLHGRFTTTRTSDPWIPTYLNQVRHAIKSRPSPDARRASANAYLKTAIKTLQDYTLIIWAGRNTALHSKTQDTELIVHAQLIADI